VDLSGLGGVSLRITLVDGTVVDLNDFLLSDFALWNTGDVYMLSYPATT
jgi:hypothetical protein